MAYVGSQQSRAALGAVLCSACWAYQRIVTNNADLPSFLPTFHILMHLQLRFRRCCASLTLMDLPHFFFFNGPTSHHCFTSCTTRAPHSSASVPATSNTLSKRLRVFFFLRSAMYPHHCCASMLPSSTDPFGHQSMHSSKSNFFVHYSCKLNTTYTHLHKHL
jgi:hypothetical protein